MKMEEDKGSCTTCLGLICFSIEKQRYWYNISTNECQEFTYYGCEGSNNNFKSKALCQEACVS